MPALKLSACLSKNPMTAPLLAGTVAPEGVDWVVSGIHPSEMFWRQLKFGDFDVSEMSLSSLSIAVSQGLQDWVAIPVFTTRRFFHTGIMVRDDAGIESPKDLIGKRVGVPEYQQTAALWARGALQHEFGVAPEQLTWFMERPPERSHGGSTAFSPPPGVDLSYIPASTTMGQMLGRGELDAAIVYISDKNLVDRTREDAGSVPRLRPLFADPVAEGIRYYESTGLLPVNHTVVIRAALLEKHPWLALNLYSAFVVAKEVALRPLLTPPAAMSRPLGHGGILDPFVQIGLLPAEAARRMSVTDPLPYGLEGQSPVFDALSSYLVEQGLVSAKLDIEQLFAKSTLDL